MFSEVQEVCALNVTEEIHPDRKFNVEIKVVWEEQHTSVQWINNTRKYQHFSMAIRR